MVSLEEEQFTAWKRIAVLLGLILGLVLLAASTVPSAFGGTCLLCTDTDCLSYNGAGACYCITNSKCVPFGICRCNPYNCYCSSPTPQETTKARGFIRDEVGPFKVHVADACANAAGSVAFAKTLLDEAREQSKEITFVYPKVKPTTKTDQSPTSDEALKAREFIRNEAGPIKVHVADAYVDAVGSAAFTKALLDEAREQGKEITFIYPKGKLPATKTPQ